MSEIVKPHILKPGSGPDTSPVLVDVRDPLDGRGACNHPWIARNAGHVSQNMNYRWKQRDHAGAGLGVGQPEFVRLKVDLVPAQLQNLSLSAAGETSPTSPGPRAKAASISCRPRIPRQRLRGSSSWSRPASRRAGRWRGRVWGRSRRDDPVGKRWRASAEPAGCLLRTRSADAGGHFGRVGGVVTEPLPPQTRACAIDALGSSPARFAQGAYAPSPGRLSTAVSCTCWWNSGFPPAFPISGSVQVTLRFPRAGPDGHGSPPSAVLSERYDFLPSHVLRLIDFVSRLRGCLPGFVSALGALPSPCRPGDGPGSGLFTLAIPFQPLCPRARAGSPRFPGDPSRDFAPVYDPGRPVAPRQ